jgi:hypothetical protein
VLWLIILNKTILVDFSTVENIFIGEISTRGPEQVLKLIEDAYNKKKKVKTRLYEANLENGILIHFYQNNDSDSGKITTAYPKYQI